ncbi:hypothetical protein [Petroclostridium sp. X23]|uniref:hypothetical protein n=1 Tax=Petroclostridium sp. X23 TaxID=3045146 RepID=UPI0024AE6015|nr:hypothetical protein [Petroclostridium sp. X23]WHH61144.1 hypothetical protein QKW49_10750 [Petroclostridium sp. X23]
MAKAAVEGDFRIDGGTWYWGKNYIRLVRLLKVLLPVNCYQQENVKDIISVDGKDYPVSIVDAGNPLVFIKAEGILELMELKRHSKSRATKSTYGFN